MYLPRVPPVTMLGPNELSTPAAVLPTLSKTAPRRSRHVRSACPAILRSAASRSRGLRREDREGPPDGARQRARWRSIAGRSRSPEATSRQGEGVCLNPCSANGAAADLWPLRDLSPPLGGSRRRCPSRCASRARRGGTDLVVVPPKPSEQGAARGAALGAMDTWGGGCSFTTSSRRPPQAGRFGAAAVDERSHSETNDATNRARDVSRERRGPHPCTVYGNCNGRRPR